MNQKSKAYRVAHTFRSRPGLCADVSDYVAQFANPVRLKLLCCLTDGERHVSELIEEVGEKQSTVSQQLGNLLRSGFLRRRREGTRIYYRIADETVSATVEHLATMATRRVEGRSRSREELR